ncbi:MAG TPA: BrnT family toxin [Allosphingosinicella sp.]|nr:BrnT family toxin [Allosphingosinicella sp.]
MIVDFDRAKDEANRAKHGVPLAFGARLFEDPRLTILPTLRLGDEEERFKAVGMVDGKLWTAVLVWRGSTVRMISVRRSNVGEQRDYDRDSG